MTTVVYKGGVLAADRRVTELNHIHGTTRKIFKLTHCMIGFCGDFVEIQKVLEWVKGGFVGSPPELRKDAEVDAIYVDNSGNGFYIQSPDFILQPLDTPYMAIGSGAMYAKGAMAAGKSAVEAVKIAMIFDANTGGGVDSIRWK